MTLIVYGIPACGTCKRAFQWLQAKGIEYEFVNTKEHPPDQQAIASWVKTLTSKPMRNTSGQSYRALGDAKKDWTEQQWIEAFAEDAMLLKRPLFVKDGAAVLVGFAAAEAVIQEKLGVS
jgi:arsenate reductase (glutaredoxin)